VAPGEEGADGGRGDDDDDDDDDDDTAVLCTMLLGNPRD
jgi:hypothetical protein